jgi:hypothetical protein
MTSSSSSSSAHPETYQGFPASAAPLLMRGRGGRGGRATGGGRHQGFCFVMW